MSVRNSKTSLEEFKLVLDQFLMEIPDHPRVPGLAPEALDMSGQQSNSIAAWTRLLQLQGWTYTPPLSVPSIPSGVSLPLESGFRPGRIPGDSSMKMDILQEVEDVWGSL